MTTENLQDLFVHELRDLYDAETRIVETLPEMIDKASSTDLKEAFQNHLEETREQVNRLEEIFRSMGQDPSGETCEGMEGLLEEGFEILEEQGDPMVVDAAIIGAAQRVEHYEIAAYGTAKTFAKRLGDNDAEKLLDKTLKEEKKADEKLTKVAESVVNPKAKKAGQQPA